MADIATAVIRAVPFGAEAVALGRAKAALLAGTPAGMTAIEWAMRFRALSARVVLEGDEGVPCYHCDGWGYIGDEVHSQICETCEGCGKTYARAATTACETCAGVGWVGSGEENMRNPAFGRATVCPTCNGRMPRAESLAPAAMVLAQADVPPGYRAFTFATLLACDLTDSQAAAAAEVSAFASEPELFAAHNNRQAVVLQGPVGTRKTGIGISALVEAATWSAGRARFVSWLALLTRINATYDQGGGESKKGILDELRRARFLVLDDFGVGVTAHGATEGAVKVAEELIEARAAGGLWTLVTTNLTPEQMEVEFSPRVASRLLGMAVWLTVEGDDARRVAG